MAQEIKKWLASDQDYFTGVALYQKYGSSDVRKRMFATGPSSFNREKLLQSLQELLPADSNQPAPLPTPALPPKKVKSSKPAATDPAQFEQLMQQRQSMLDERTVAHAKLTMVGTDEARLELALRILELVPAIKKLNYLRKYYLEHGCLPEELNPKSKVDETDQSSLLQRRNNLRTYRSRLKKNHPEKAEELEALNTEIERLTTLINSK